ncbi:MAG: (p)ppGpp synthetase [Treponema sp.]|nr:(p)ppGpp synthetase [Treponema sp.]
MEKIKTNDDNLFSRTDKNAILHEFEKHSETRHLIVNDIREQIENALKSLDTNPVISGRIKNFSSYFNKYLRLLKNGEKDPKITDLLGIRIICPFIEDLPAADDLICANFNVIEREIKGHYTFKEFGYESTHLLIAIPKQITEKHGYPGTDTVEIQIRTILQDAWAEVEHELVYKAELNPFDEPMRRKLAAVNASLSLADIIFQEIRGYQRSYTKEMEKRRESFYKKVEESTDNLLFSEKSENIQDSLNALNQKIIEPETNTQTVFTGTSIDDLLINALTSHNQNRFDEAINQYTNILELKPVNIIRSLILKHRGMAFFACSKYNEAINDFSASIELDSDSYKAAYYRGVVYSVTKQYLKAIDDYTLSLSLNPYQSFCLFRRAQAFYHIEDFPQSLADCEHSLALEPDHAAAVKFKELLLEKLKM